MWLLSRAARWELRNSESIEKHTRRVTIARRKHDDACNRARAVATIGASQEGGSCRESGFASKGAGHACSIEAELGYLCAHIDIRGRVQFGRARRSC